MEVYPDGHGYCFACNFYAKDAGEPTEVQGKDTYVENVQESVRHIQNLPLLAARGLNFHHDSNGFYILWPNAPYYKYRLLGAEESNRYRSPTGVKKPLFVARDTGGRGWLIIVEGEINALSIAKAMPEHAVCSPGGVSDFVSKRALSEYLPFYRRYAKIVVIGDHDDPGKRASTLLMLELQKDREVLARWMSTDANELLQQENGEERVRQEVEHLMGVRRRVPNGPHTMPSLRDPVTELGA